MLLGLDVGGTHTDAVIIGREGLVSSAKIITRHDNILSSINEALERVLDGIDRDLIKNINLSTTLSTNAIVENKIEEVAVLVSSGPGIDPKGYEIGNCYYIISGSIDHRGEEKCDLDDAEIKKAADICRERKIKVYGVISKFSTRNPSHENHITSFLEDHADFITSGHQLSGSLNFPRRIATAFYNSAVWRTYNNFTDSIIESINKLGINAPVNILKADGGTMPVGRSRSLPVESILSGPAASVIGIIALCDIAEDSIILDIGGTTTDIAIFYSGSPLIEAEGIAIGGHPTLVRALKTKSIGIGGDSLIKISDSLVSVGPERSGPSMADGGDSPSLIDAMNYKNIISYGSRERSVSGMEMLSKEKGVNPGEIADRAIEYSIGVIKSEVDAVIDEINSKPLYTVHEILENKKIVPKKIYVMGGPARDFAGLITGKFGIDVTVPDNYSVANAVGAALARTTLSIQLFADTERRTMLIPSLNIETEIPADYSLEDAESDAKRHLVEYIKKITGNDGEAPFPEIIESSAFNMTSGFYTTGKNIRVKCQVKPGVIDGYKIKGF